jgi:glycosyltransferase involved in cell wall biosynthesis
MRPKLGIIDFNPIQYRTPLYQRLVKRGNVQLGVLFLSDHGYRRTIDPGFGVPVSWDIDLLSGYPHEFLASADGPNKIDGQLRTLVRWLKQHDAVVIYGYVKPWMLCAMAACRSLRIPYILRGESHVSGQATGVRRHVRDAVAYTAVSLSSGALAIGQLNEQFYRKYGGGRRITFAPYSVDDERFAQAPLVGRSELLARWGLDASRPVIMFCGKLIPRKRPLDLAAAVRSLPDDVTTVFVGDGPMAEQVRAALKPGCGAVTGFVNQSELPSYFHAADILVLPSNAEPWGLVVNEAMAAGVLPVTSDRVGAAPDLVSGLGEVYPCGDVCALGQALRRALEKAARPQTRDEVRRHVARYSLDVTAAGFEKATLAVAAGPQVMPLRMPQRRH